MKTKKTLRLVLGLLVIGALLMAGNFAWASPAAERPMVTHTKGACQGAELISMFETVDLGQGYTVTRGFQPDSLGVFADVYDLRLNGEQLAVVSAQMLGKNIFRLPTNTKHACDVIPYLGQVLSLPVRGEQQLLTRTRHQQRIIRENVHCGAEEPS
jgi:hypothetical protein